jgi:hypothetical protein
VARGELVSVTIVEPEQAPSKVTTRIVRVALRIGWLPFTGLSRLWIRAGKPEVTNGQVVGCEVSPTARQLLDPRITFLMPRLRTRRTEV